MDEYISKSKAIKTIRTDPMGGLNYERLIKSIPAADVVEREKGHWISRVYPKRDGYFEMKVCPICREEFSYDAETGVGDYNFCPNCGADMR